MPTLVDGNNVLHRLPSGQRTREALRRRVLEFARAQRMVMELIFDGPPPQGTPDVEHLGRVTIRYSGSGTADDLIVRRLPPDASAGNWTVVTDDRQLARRADAKGARTMNASAWLQRLPAAPAAGGEKPERMSPEELAEWLDIFSNR